MCPAINCSISWRFVLSPLCSALYKFYERRGTWQFHFFHFSFFILAAARALITALHIHCFNQPLNIGENVREDPNWVFFIQRNYVCLPYLRPLPFKHCSLPFLVSAGLRIEAIWWIVLRRRNVVVGTYSVVLEVVDTSSRDNIRCTGIS